MWKKIVALCLALMLPGAVSAGPLTASAEKAGRELARAQSAMETRSRSRFWTGIALVAGGGALALLGGAEFGDDETGPDDEDDRDGSDDGEDSDGWGNKAMLGGGIASAVLGGVVMMSGRKTAGPVVSLRRRGVSLRHTVRF